MKQTLNKIKQTKNTILEFLLPIKDVILGFLETTTNTQYWKFLLNYFIIIIAYSSIYDKPNVLLAETLLGLWLFASVSYLIYTFFKK